jgi:Zn-dependent alcohol dehydrogenase
LDKAIKEIVPLGTNFNIDTTGVLPIIKAGVSSIQAGGQLILIGIMSGLKLEVDLSDLLANGKTIRGVVEGNAKPCKVSTVDSKRTRIFTQVFSSFPN